MDLKPEFKSGRLHEDFQAESFVQLGDYLSSLERRATVSTQTATDEGSYKAQSTSREKMRSPWRALTIARVLAVIIALLLGANGYIFSTKRKLEAENSALKARVAELNLERSREGAEQAPACSTPVTPVTGNTCPNEIINTCFFKMSLGPCLTEAFEDPIGRTENSLRFAWESTTEVIDAIGKTVSEDFRKLGKKIHSVGASALDLLGCLPE